MAKPIKRKILKFVDFKKAKNTVENAKKHPIKESEDTLFEWVNRLQGNYENFEEFEDFDETYGISKRLGYSDSTTAWEDNPLVTGGTDPEKLKKMDPTKGVWDIFNVTDGVYASNEPIKGYANAEKFVLDFAKKYSTQGYYLTADRQRIKPEDVELDIVPHGEKPEHS